jgi:choline-sulfatase
VIGDLLLRLEAGGLLDNTIVIYTSDHGEMAGEHNLWWKHTWHEASARVPLLVSTPQQRQGKQPRHICHTPVALIDLFPTICALANIATPRGLDGVDLSSVITAGSDAPEHPIFCDNLVPRWAEGRTVLGKRV